MPGARRERRRTPLPRAGRVAVHLRRVGRLRRGRRRGSRFGRLGVGEPAAGAHGFEVGERGARLIHPAGAGEGFDPPLVKHIRRGRVRRGEARASMVMDHGRSGPRGVLGGEDGGLNTVRVETAKGSYVPPHLSKDQDIRIEGGDSITVMTPGGGGYGNAMERDPDLVARDVRRGYFTVEQAKRNFGVVIDAGTLAVDRTATSALRAAK